MQTLELIYKIAQVQSKLEDLVQGLVSPQEIKRELNELAALLVDDSTMISDKYENTKSAPNTSNKKIENNTKTIALDGVFYLNTNKTLLFKIETNEEGVAFQEKYGYVIFVENKDLHLLRKIEDFTDSYNLKWKISPTDNEYVVVAESEVGDTIIGMKEVEELITGFKEISVG